jgi:hypothetical protein
MSSPLTTGANCHVPSARLNVSGTLAVMPPRLAGTGQPGASQEKISYNDYFSSFG